MTRAFPADAVSYPTSPRYKFLVGAGAALTGLLGWELWQGRGDPADEFAWGLGFFFVVSFLVTLWYAREMLSRVILAANAITVTRRPGRARTVEFRQMVSVSEAGRLGGRSITIVFHPLRADGLIDLEGADSLIVPEVDDHDGLLAVLEARAPA
jgi:hypothetical protein